MRAHWAKAYSYELAGAGAERSRDWVAAGPAGGSGPVE